MSNWGEGNQQGWGGGQPQNPNNQGWGQPGPQGQPVQGQQGQGQQGQWGQQPGHGQPPQQGQWGQPQQGPPQQGQWGGQPGQQGQWGGQGGQPQPGQQGQWNQHPGGNGEPQGGFPGQPPRGPGGPSGQPAKKKWLLPVIIGGAVVIIAALVLGLTVFNKDKDEVSSPTTSEPTGVRPSRQPAPSQQPEPTTGGGSPQKSEKSANAALPEKVGEFSRQGDGAAGSASYMKGQDFDSMIVAVAQAVPIGADDYLDAAGAQNPEAQGNFLCAEASGQKQCVAELSDGILVVMGDGDIASTGAFANQLLEAI